MERIAHDSMAPYVIEACADWTPSGAEFASPLGRAALRHLELLVGAQSSDATTTELVALASRADLLSAARDRVRRDAKSSDPWTRFLSGRRTAGLAKPVQNAADRARDTWASIRGDLAVSRAFDQHMIQRSRPLEGALGLALADTPAGAERTLVDVGGGPGQYAIQFLRVLGRAWWAIVVDSYPDAGWYAMQSDSDLAQRISVRIGDAFATLPRGADVYLLGSIIHDLSDEASIALLSRCAQVASEGAALVTIEREWDPRSLDHSSRDLDMRILFGGRERSTPELHLLLSQAGFTVDQSLVTDGYRWICAYRTSEPLEGPEDHD